MNKFLKAGCAAFAVASLSSAALADGYGTAGCGLGSIAFGDKPGMIQILAATTNGTSGNQTFAITTGTSNCGDSEVSEDLAADFIETNREAFAKDAARGNGETIASLAEIAGCQSAAQVGSVLQGEFGNIFTSADATDQQVSNRAVEALKAHQELACSELI